MMKRTFAVLMFALVAAVPAFSPETVVEAHAPRPASGDCWSVSKKFADENGILIVQAPAAPAAAPAPAPKEAPKQDWSKKGRGYKLPPAHVRFQTHQAAFKRHGHRMARHVQAMTAPATWDSRTLGWIPPIRDQGNCGDCYGVSASDSTTCAFTKAGLQKADGSFVVSEQYGLDSGAYDGGCNGGDGPQVMDWIKSKGFPAEKYVDSTGKSVSDYPAYTASPGRDRLTPQMKLWKPADWLFVTSDQSDRAPTLDEIKAGIMNYGNVSFAFDASNLDGSPVTRLGNNIDHEITGAVGWDDAKKMLLCRNQWGVSFGDGGYFWMAYTCLPQIVEAYSVVAAPLPPPPTPPTPPGPGPGPQPSGLAITSALTASANLGAAFSYQITASGSPTDFAAAGLPAGLVCADATGAITGTPQTSGTFSVTLSAANKTGTATAVLALTVAAPAPTPSNPTFTISQPLPAGTYEIVPAGSVVITKDMTVQQVIDLLSKKATAPAPPAKCCQPPPADPQDDVKAAIAELKRGYAAVITAIEQIRAGK